MTPDRPGTHWFEDMADHMGPEYLRYSFTRGTEQEVDFLVEELGLRAGMRVLDVGCGPGRHSHALAMRGIETHGIDISDRFVELASVSAPDGATFERLDARRLDFDSEFDAALSLCQGAFGLASTHDAPAIGAVDPDGVVLDGIARALKPGGAVAVSAFSAYFQVRYLDDGDEFDADRGVNHERTELAGENGEAKPYDLWTSCFTPRELRLMAASSGIATEAIYSVTPGKYRRNPPTIEEPEYLLIGRRAR